MTHYKSIADYKSANGLTPPEERLVAACRNGESCPISDTRPEHPTPETTIRADLLRLLITGASPICDLSDSGVWLHGAYITGTLDLDFATAKGMTTLDACTFAAKPRMQQTHLRHLSLEDSHLPGLYAPNMVVAGSVLLSRLTSTTTVDVNGARITGHLSCIGATLNGQTGPEAWGSALSAQGVTVGESLFLSNLTATGMVDVNGAQITGQLACDGATLNGQTGPEAWEDALNAQGVTVGASLFLSNLTATGMVDVTGAQITGQLACDGATLNGRTGPEAWGSALSAQGVTVGASLFLRNLKATGMVDVTGAQITGQLACDGATLNGQTGPEAWGRALNAEGATVGADLFLRNLTATGMVDVKGAQITGQLACEGASFDGKGDKAINAQRMVVKHGFIWRRVKETKGQVYLAGAVVGDLVDDPASWPADLYLDGFTYDRISAASTDAKSRLEWLRKGATYQGTFYPQPYAQLAKVLSQTGHDRDARTIRMAAKQDAAAHLRAIERPQRHFARAFRRVSATKGGNFFELNDLFPKLPKDKQASATETLGRFKLFHVPAELPNDPTPLSETTLHLARQQFRNEMWWAVARSRLRTAWSSFADLFMRWIVGYGYAPWRAFYVMLVCVLPAAWLYSCAYAAGAIVPNSDVVLTSFGWFWSILFAPDTPTLIWDDSGTARHYETFYGLAYAFDVFVPLVDLGQQSAWSATTITWAGWWARIGTMVLEVVGWVITALGAAAITGIIQRDRS